MQPEVRDRPLLFVHIPKTGGTSLRSLLHTRFDAAETLHIEGSEAVQLEQATHVGEYRFVAGHVGFEFASTFPCAPALVTMLREPIARSLSAFEYLRSLEPAAIRRAPLAREARRARELDLLAYIEQDPVAAADHVGNVQTWHMAMGGVRRSEVARLTAVDLDRACANLRRCVAVGVMQRYDDSLAVLCARLPCAPFAEAPRANQGLSGRTPADLDARTIDALVALTRLDAELYRAACDELERGLSLASADVAANRGETGLVPLTAEPVELTFDRAIPGAGWYGRERIHDRWFCWTGPGRESWLELPRPAGDDVTLRVRVVGCVDARVLNGLTASVNGQPVTLRRADDLGGQVFTGRLPRPDGSVRPCRIELQVPETLRPRDLDPGAADSRRLGVAIEYVGLLPRGSRPTCVPRRAGAGSP